MINHPLLDSVTLWRPGAYSVKLNGTDATRPFIAPVGITIWLFMFKLFNEYIYMRYLCNIYQEINYST